MAVAALKRPSGRSGFTLLEILITLGLIGLLTGVLVIGTNRLLETQPKSPDEVFWAVVAEVRKDAMLNQREVRLSFDTKSHLFVASTMGADTRIPFVEKTVAEFDFLPPKSTGGYSAILVGGDLVETNTIQAVTFYRDGTCTPFRAQLKTRNGTRVLDIDPWTCAPMLAAQPDASR